MKPLLYVYRVLLTGIHLMRSGEIEANLPRLNDVFRLPFVPDLIARKTSGTERTELDRANLSFHKQEYRRLVAELERARDSTALPEVPSARSALHDLPLELRGAAPASSAEPDS